MNIDYNSMTDKELEDIYFQVTEVRRRREKEKEDKDWKQVVDAIYKYVEKYGEIDICSGDFYISEDCDFSSVGEIHLSSVGEIH